MKKLKIFGMILLLMSLTQVTWQQEAQQFNVEVLHNQTLPGMTIIGIGVYGTIPQDTTALYDLYVNYDGDLNYEDEEKI